MNPWNKATKNSACPQKKVGRQPNNRPPSNSQLDHVIWYWSDHWGMLTCFAWFLVIRIKVSSSEIMANALCRTVSKVGLSGWFYAEKATGKTFENLEQSKI